MISRVKHLKFFFNDSDKKGMLKMAKEMIIFGWIKKELPTDYYRKFLYRKDIINYKDYLSLNEYSSIVRSDKMIFPEISTILSNKLSFFYHCDKLNFPTPKIISYNLKNSFFYNEKLIPINKKADLFLFFETVFNDSGKEKLFLKLLNASRGFGCILLEKNNLNEQIDFHKNNLLKNSYIHQELILQHPNISKIHDNAVNTLRIDTYIDNNLEAHVLSVLMRYGIGKGFTDNAHTGGFYISVNQNTGRLQGKGRQDITKGGSVYIKHPDSRVILESYQIPYFNEACDLAERASMSLPNRIIGWDVAISETGPILIEGNENPSLHMTDVAYGGYCKHPKIKEILKFIKEK